MKLTPVTGPGAIAPNGTPEHVRTARAVAAFNRAAGSQAPTQGQAQATPVANPSSVSVEELGAIKQTYTDDTYKQQLESQEEQVASSDNNTPTEDSPTPEEAKPKEDPALSRQFAQLARQERQLRVKAQQQKAALDAREADLKAREAALTQNQFDPKDYVPRSRIKQEALTVLAEEGVSYDELTQQIIGRQPVDPQLQAHINRLEAKLATMEKQAEQSQKSYTEQQQQAYQAAVKQIETDAKSLVKSDPQAYEAIAKTGSVRDVVDLIVKTHEKTGVVMSVEEAAQEVENYLVEEGFNVSTRIDKIKRRIQQAAQPKGSPQQTQAKPAATPSMKTLTNATASTRKLSARERALLAFKGELKP